MKKLSILFLGLLTAGTISASTFYASPSGNGNGSSYASPCSFSEGLKKLTHGGDTLYLLGGQYSLGKTNVSVSGNANANVVISGYPGEQAILDFRTTPYGTRGLCIASGCNYVHIKDLTLRYSGKNNLYNEGSNCTFENLDIYGSADTGCQMKKGGNNLIKNVDSHDNFDYGQTRSGEDGEILADFGGNADGFADKQFTGPGNHYIGCRAWNNSDDGWDFYQRISSGNETVIENCICYQNGPAYYDMRNHPRYQTDRSWFDSHFNTTIRDRYLNTLTITAEHYPNLGNGNGFKLGGGQTDHNVTIHHSLSVGNTVKGFDQNSDAGIMHVYNNTAFDNGQNYGFYNTACGTLYIRNCISHQSRSANTLTVLSVAADEYNTWNISGLTLSNSDFASYDISHILDLRDAAGNLPQSVIRLFAPSSANAQMVDRGTNVGLSYYGTAPDLGWQEWQEGNAVVPDEPTPDPEPEPYECQPGSRPIAFVTTPGAPEDARLTAWLQQFDSLCITITDAGNPSEDYSMYELIVVGPKPSSTAAGFSQLKGIDKPMLVLKPWLFKPSVWNWGNAVNTNRGEAQINDSRHPIFKHILFENPDEPLRAELQTVDVFRQVNTNGLTCISSWTNVNGKATIATLSEGDWIVEFPAGATANGTTFRSPLMQLGISEYSTANLTDNGCRLVSNAIFHMLGMDPQAEDNGNQPNDDPDDTKDALEQLPTSRAEKLFRNGQILIMRDGHLYTVTGQLAE